ncbi:hypothetical protein [Streptomyces sp. NBC_00154]|uniref:hypothetical protein n=1 Tax=Streptomyces sp. NBC_00154 TaxID=2975670 RepID=UPI0022503AB0|nr:hypothetical protein [Streptomyces sp. NBC_00154]MCX5315822.1 hypothetical protein [Streptomyces sp. NBC_00154]
MRYFNLTGWLAIFNGTESAIGRTVAVETWDESTGTALVVDPAAWCAAPGHGLPSGAPCFLTV